MVTLNIFTGARNKKDYRNSLFCIFFWTYILYILNLTKVITSELKFIIKGIAFNIMICPYLCSNIPSFSEYGVYILKLIRYARASTTYSDFLKAINICVTDSRFRGMQKCVLKELFFRYQSLIEK